MKRVTLFGAMLLALVLIPARVFAQTPDPECAKKFEVGSVDYYKCTGVIYESGESLESQYTTMYIIVAITAVGVIALVAGSQALYRRRMSNVPASEMRAMIVSLVPPEVGNISDEAIDHLTKQYSSPSSAAKVPIPMLLGPFLIFIALYVVRNNTLSIALIGAFLLYITIMAIRAVIVFTKMSQKGKPPDPLGFSTIASPSLGYAPSTGGLSARGAAVAGGMRFGREVTVTYASNGFGLRLTTLVRTQVTEPFQVKGKDNDWISKPLPGRVAEALNRFAPLDKKVTIRGDDQGVWVERDQTSTEVTSARGLLAKLKDLQMAEAVADSLR